MVQVDNQKSSFSNSEISCGDPGMGNNTERRDGDNFEYGAKLLYLCPLGSIDETTNKQSLELECLADKNWSYAPPTCVRKFEWSQARPGSGLLVG